MKARRVFWAAYARTSPLTQFRVRECPRECHRLTDRVRFTWLIGVILGQVLERSAALLGHSFILFRMFVMDASGVRWL
jgi:hypothetical protein